MRVWKFRVGVWGGVAGEGEELWGFRGHCWNQRGEGNRLVVLVFRWLEYTVLLMDHISFLYSLCLRCILTDHSGC